MLSARLRQATAFLSQEMAEIVVYNLKNMGAFNSGSLTPPNQDPRTEILVVMLNEEAVLERDALGARRLVRSHDLEVCRR